MAKAAIVVVALFGAVACACGGTGVECKPADVCAEDYPSVSAAVAACSSRGGGRVTVGPGVTKSDGPVVLRSNVELHLEEGATIEFSDRPEDYMPGVPVSWEGIECYNLSPLVYAYDCTNVAITGRGVLKAKTAFWWSWAGTRTSECQAAARLLKGEWPRTGTPIVERQLWKQPGAAFRPQFLHFNHCKDVRLEGVSVRGSPFWTIHAFLCDGVTLRDLDVDATGDDGRMINNSDGIDVDSSRNVLIENCTFAQGDDAIVLKSGRDFDGWRIATPTENVVVRGCTVRSGHNLLAIGSELSGGIRNVSVSNCRVVGVIGELVNIKTNRRRGGFVEGVRLENIVAGRIRYDVIGLNTRHYYGAPGNEALEQDRPTLIRGIVVRNVRCLKAPRRFNLRGDFLRPAADFTADNVVVDDCESGDYVASVENLRIDGRPVRPTAVVATADELGSVDLDAAIWQPETKEYLLATTDGTVAGTAIRRSLDRKLWSEPVPSLWAEERFSDAAVGFVKIRREKNGWYMDVSLDSVPRSYFTPEIFWPFRPESFFAPKAL